MTSQPDLRLIFIFRTKPSLHFCPQRKSNLSAKLKALTKIPRKSYDSNACIRTNAETSPAKGNFFSSFTRKPPHKIIVRRLLRGDGNYLKIRINSAFFKAVCLLISLQPVLFPGSTCLQRL